MIFRLIGNVLQSRLLDLLSDRLAETSTSCVILYLIVWTFLSIFMSQLSRPERGPESHLSSGLQESTDSFQMRSPRKSTPHVFQKLNISQRFIWVGAWLLQPLEHYLLAFLTWQGVLQSGCLCGVVICSAFCLKMAFVFKECLPKYGVFSLAASLINVYKFSYRVRDEIIQAASFEKL